MELKSTLNQNKTFQNEQNELFYSLIKNNFYERWNGNIPYNCDDIYDTPTLELQITPTCNKSCRYCYLVKYGDDLYPKEFRNQEQILNNISILLDYYIEQNFIFPRVDLFSGEIWHTDFGIKILITVLAKLQVGLKIKTLIIPSNFTFINYPDKVKQIRTLINQFEQSGCHLVYIIILCFQKYEIMIGPRKNFLNILIALIIC